MPGLSIDSINSDLRDNKFASPYVEAVAVDHCKRWWPTYYIKGKKGVVDIAVVKDGSMYPVEVKWTKRIRAEDIKEIQGYSNGIILIPWSQKKTINSDFHMPFLYQHI